MSNIEAGKVVWRAVLDVSPLKTQLKDFLKFNNTFQIKPTLDRSSFTLIKTQLQSLKNTRINLTVDTNLKTVIRQVDTLKKSLKDLNDLSVNKDIKIKKEIIVTNTSIGTDPINYSSDFQTIISYLKKIDTRLELQGRAVAAVAPAAGTPIELLNTSQQATQILTRSLTPLQNIASILTKIAALSIAKDVFKNVGFTVGGGVLKQTSKSFNAVDKARQQANETAQNTKNNFKEVGKNVSEGIKTGINIQDIGNVGKTIGKQLLNSTKKFLGIKSPSKKFADEVGKPILQGIKVQLDNLDTVTIPFKKDLQKFVKDAQKEVSFLNQLVISGLEKVESKTYRRSSSGRKNTGFTPFDLLNNLSQTTMFFGESISGNQENYTQRKITNIKNPNIKTNLEKEVSTIQKNLSNINKDVLITIDGISSNTDKASTNLKNWAKATFKDAEVFSVTPEISDTKNIAEMIENFTKYYKQGEINPDALKTAATILSVSRKAKDKNITAVGRGIGGNIVNEALFILEQAGYGAELQNVRGFGIGTVRAADPYQSERFTSRVSKYSPLRNFGVTEQGNVDLYKFAKENVIKAGVVTPLVTAASLAFPPLGAARATMAVPNLLRKRSKLISRGLGDEEFIQDINPYVRPQAGNRGIYPFIGATSRAVSLPFQPITSQLGRGISSVGQLTGLNVPAQGIAENLQKIKPLEIGQFIRSEEELIKQRKDFFSRQVKETKEHYKELEQVNFLGLGSIFSFTKQSMDRLVKVATTGFAAFSAFNFLLVIPDLISNLGVAYATQIEPLKNSVNSLSSNAEAFENISKASTQLGVSLDGLAGSYRNLLLLSKNNVLSTQQATNITFDLAEISAGFGLQAPQQQDLYQQVASLLGRDPFTAESVRTLETTIPGITEMLKSSTGMGTQELQNRIATGEIDKTKTIIDLIERLKLESAVYADTAMSSTLSAQNRLQAEINVFQEAVGSTGLDEINTFFINLQITAVKTLKPILLMTNDILEVLGVAGIAGALIGLRKVFLAFGKTMTDPKLAGINIFDKLYDSITVVAPRLTSFTAAIGRLLIGVKAVMKAFAPILALGAGITAITNVFEGLNETHKETEAQLKKLTESYKLLIKTSKDNEQSIDTNIADPTERFKGLFGGLQGINPFSDRFIISEMIKQTRSGGLFQRVSGETDSSLQASITLKEQSVIMNERKNIEDILKNFNLIRQQKAFIIQPENLAEVKETVKDLQSQIKIKETQVVKLKAEGDFEAVSDLKRDIRGLKEESESILISNFGNVNALRAGLEVQSKILDSYKDILSSAGFTEESFVDALNRRSPQDLEQLAQIEPAVARKGFSSLQDFAKTIQQFSSNVREGEKVLTDYDNTFSGLSDNIRRLSVNIGEIEASNFNNLFAEQGRETRALTQANRRYISGDISRDTLSQTQLQIRRESLQERSANLKNTTKEVFKEIESLSQPNKEIIKEALGVTGDLMNELTNNENLSPQGIRTLLQNLQDIPGIKEITDTVVKYLDFSRQEQEVQNQISEVDVQIKDSGNDITSYYKSLQDLDMRISDSYRERSRMLEDQAMESYQRNQDFSRSFRDFNETIFDFNTNIQNSLNQAKEQLSLSLTNLDFSRSFNNLKESFGIGSGSLFKNFANTLEEIFSTELALNEKELSLEEQRLQAEKETLELTREIRSLNEQKKDLEFSRYQQLISVARQQQDFVREQERSWNAISEEVSKMREKGQQMGIDFTTIADAINQASKMMSNAVTNNSSMASGNITSGGMLGYGFKYKGLANPLEGINFASTAQQTSGFYAPRSGGRTHFGADYYAKVGTPVASAVTGKVVETYPDKGEWGIKVQTLDGVIRQHMNHLKTLTVKVGDIIQAGQQIGTSGGARMPDGSPGSFGSTGAHLDLKFQYKGKFIPVEELYRNPQKYITAEMTKALNSTKPVQVKADTVLQPPPIKDVKQLENKIPELNIPTLDTAKVETELVAEKQITDEQKLQVEQQKLLEEKRAKALSDAEKLANFHKDFKNQMAEVFNRQVSLNQSIQEYLFNADGVLSIEEQRSLKLTEMTNKYSSLIKEVEDYGKQIKELFSIEGFDQEAFDSLITSMQELGIDEETIAPILKIKEDLEAGAISAESIENSIQGYVNNLTNAAKIAQQTEEENLQITNQISRLDTLSSLYGTIANKQKELTGTKPYEQNRLEIMSKSLAVQAEYKKQFQEIANLEKKYKEDQDMLNYLQEIKGEFKRLQEIDLKSVGKQVSLFEDSVSQPLRNAFESLIDGIGKGTLNLKDIFRNFLTSIADFFTNLSGQLLQNFAFGNGGILSNLFGGGGFTTSVSGGGLGGILGTVGNIAGGLFGGGGITNVLGGAIGGLFGGGSSLTSGIGGGLGVFGSGGLGGLSFMAKGGNVTANKPYIVGEEGMELFIPKTPGIIIPNTRLNTPNYDFNLDPNKLSQYSNTSKSNTMTNQKVTKNYNIYAKDVDSFVRSSSMIAQDLQRKENRASQFN